jgi:hypothetical protein
VEQEKFIGGVIKYANGVTYQGDLKNQKKHGKGTLLFANDYKVVVIYLVNE